MNKTPTKTVLIVEDEAFLLRTLTKHLEDLNYKIETAMNGQEALDSIEKSQPDLILTDLVMPKMDGFDFLKQLKSGPHKNIPVVVITNLAAASDETRCRELGIEGYLTKSDTPLIEIEGIIKKYLS